MRLSFSRIASWLGGFALTFGAVQVAGNELLHLQDSNLQFSTLPYSAGESFLSFATERPAFTAGLSPKVLAELPGHTPAPLQMRLSGAQAAPAPGQGGNLLGPAFDLQAPGFDYLTLSLYDRDDQDEPGHSVQFSGAWAYAFRLGEASWMLDGGLDWAGAEGDREQGLSFSPQLSFDAGDYFFAQGRQLFLGIQYLQQSGGYSELDDVRGNASREQRAVNGTLKYHF
ncbi:hypothetical protein [Pseudomonas sp. zfem005]|uniref:hypothetical protein n=1 Tax=Pseudomonas sp. zfem005 TaxID=3078200 RepID=UPI0029279B81|nr:hypothetical protein [Pseudomonas sp. zfem005]MDU9411283.1 hypothetical protein [Pseudomonas sp. zfem005]